ncbi:TauD/TfdA family dioxygenase [Streptomyces sp. NPDC015131]|uniref:TauD/TfdA family dioxygenase n=1 Tax=Streptomyces sp. NPDC015131 TaxID=3364941 RepID=UPI0036FEB8A8
MQTPGPLAVTAPRAWDRDTLRDEDLMVPVPTAWVDALRTVPPDRRWTSAPPPPARFTDDLVHRLREGPGVAVVRGWPLRGLSDRQCLDLAHWFTAFLGTPRPTESGTQGHVILTAHPQGHKYPAPGTTHPQDPGPPAPATARPDAAEPPPAEPPPAVAPSPAAAPPPPAQDADDRDLAFHTDRAGPPGPPRLLGLLCVRQAAYGGESLLASGHTVHNRLLERYPTALPRLRRDFHFGRGDGFDRVHPVFRLRDGTLLTRYNRHWIERGQEEAGAPLSPGDRAALDAVDAVLADPRTARRVRLRPGDFLLLDNTAVLHGRTAFTDATDDPECRRCLVRVWVD